MRALEGQLGGTMWGPRLVAGLVWLTVGGLPATAAEVSGADRGIVVVDQTLPEAFKTKSLGWLAHSCSFMIDRLGDEGRPLGRIDQLKRDLAAAGVPGDATLRVRDYRLYLNQATITKQSARCVAAATVGVGAVCSGRERPEPSCSRAMTPEGWFAPEEVTTHRSPLIVEISAEFAGRTYAVHSVYSPDVELAVGERVAFMPNKAHRAQSDKVGAPHVEAAFRQANARLAEMIKADTTR